MIDEHLMRPTDIARNKVDPSRAAKRLGWKAKSGMKQVVSMMLESEIASLRAGGSV
jgi:GDPmannose 4,6-dehydratase